MKKIGFAVGLIILGISFSNVNAQSSVNDKESARIFVQKFYDEYCRYYISSHKGYLASTDYFIKNKPQYFNDNLLVELKIFEAEGDIFSPFVSLKYGDDKLNYQTGNVYQIGNIFNIDVHYGLKSESRQNVLDNPVAVIVKVEDVSNQYKIVNFYYSPFNLNRNLLKIIEQFKRDKERNLKTGE